MSSSGHKIMTPEERAAKFVPPWEKDVCTDLLIELNACRRKNLYWRGTCEHELHAYEKCEYRGMCAHGDEMMPSGFFFFS